MIKAVLSGKAKGGNYNYDFEAEYYDFEIELEKYHIEGVDDEIQMDKVIHDEIITHLREKYGEDIEYLESVIWDASVKLYLREAFPFDVNGIYILEIPYTEFFRILGQKTFLTRYLQNGKLKGTMPMLVDRMRVIAKNGNDEYIGYIVIFPDALAFTHSLP